MAGNSSGRAQYTVACSCGANLTLDARSFGKPRPCRCGASVTVAWGRDPKSRKTVPVAMTQKKAAPKATAAAPAAPAAPQDLVKALCGCGNSKRVPASQSRNPPRCICGKLMRIEEAPPPPKAIGKIQKFERAKPSAPLLPLHLRAPLKARVKKGAQFFDCVCGDRVLIRAGTESRPIQCPACDRFHVVEIDAPPPPGPAPVPGAKPRGAAPPPTRPLTLGEFLCQCGEIQPPRTSRTGRDFACKKCGRKGHVEIDKDPETQGVKMRPIFTSGPTAAPAAAAAAPGAPPPPPPAGSPAWTCTCGRAIEAHVVMSKSDASCPGCGRRIRLEKWRHPHSTMTMIKPVFSDPPPAAKAPSSAPAPAVGDLVSFEELEPMEMSFTEAAVFETAAGSHEGDAPPAVDADAQIVPCECGAELLLSADDAGHTIQCPACGDTMTVEGTSDAQTGAVTLALRVVGALDDPDWKLEEFQ
ncbi:MAG: hypothetical protein HY293_15035 [Planctomycetes bacterium]|nr:hypothetical protein [Planctomycetota bacterium]